MDQFDVIAGFMPLISTLESHDVRYVLVGSVAALLYGVTGIQPGDLDVVPDCAPENLARLLSALTELGATTEPGGGEWSIDERGEWTWITRELTDEQRASWHWVPDIYDWRSFDRTFTTPHGTLDVVPQISGSYAELAQRATPMELANAPVLVTALEDLLARLTVPRRTKDVDRVRQLRALQFQRLAER